MSIAEQASMNGASGAEAPANTLVRRILVDKRCAVAGYRLAGALHRAELAADEGRARLSLPSLPDASGGLHPSSKPNVLRCTGAQLAEFIAGAAMPGASRWILEMQPSPGVGRAPASFEVEQLRQARSAGFRLAFEARWLNDQPELARLAAVVLLPMRILSPDLALSTASHLRQLGVEQSLATDVRTDSEFKRLSGAGIDLFEGRWFSRAADQPLRRTVETSYISLIELMNLVRREAELSEIEALFRHEPALSFRLLRYINTSGFGRHLEVTSFRHAVMTVGMKRLFRWTAILLASTPADHVAPATSTVAIVRGRVMELLAAGTMTPLDAELAFVAGMFSMLDVLLGMSLQEALALVRLPQEVNEAVLHGKGVFAPYLMMAKACEAGDEGLIEILAMRHGISRDRMVDAHARALDWAERLD